MSDRPIVTQPAMPGAIVMDVTPPNGISIHNNTVHRGAESLVIQPVPADTTDNSAAINAVATVLVIFAIVALVLTLLSVHPKGGRK